MGSSIKTKLIAGCGIILVVGCLLPPGCHGASTVAPSRTGSDPAHHPRGGSSAPVHRFDTKEKLVGFNRAVGERLQRTETDLRPLQRRAARLERLVSNFQHKRPAPLQKRKDGQRSEPSNLERNGLLREANRLRTDVDRKLLGFRELDRNYRNVRQLLPTPGSKGAATVTAATTSALPRAWLDRDTERQMEQNERVYKNIINLLVQLIEVPVNIIHDMVGDGGADGGVIGPAASAPNDTDYPGAPAPEQATEPNEYAFEYDEEAFLPETAINAVDGEAEGPANVVQDAEWVQFHY